MAKKTLYNLTTFLFLLILSLSFVSASDFTPQGDINLRSIYDIINGANATFNETVTADRFVGDGSGLSGINSSAINSSNSNVNSSKFANESVYWANMTQINSSMFTKCGSFLCVLQSWWDALFAPKTAIESLATNVSTIEDAQGDYLNKSDQRFNESVSVASAATNASNDNSTQGLLIETNKADIDSIESAQGDYLNKTDQRFNNTVEIAGVRTNLTTQIAQQIADNDTLKAEIDAVDTYTRWLINSSALRNESNVLGVVWSLWTNFFKSITDSNNDNDTQKAEIDTKLDSSDQRYNDTTAINLKLDITDQRYNDTSEISGVRTNLTNQISQQVDDNNTQKAEIDLKLATSDQRYNNSNVGRWSFNASALRNESGVLGVVMSLWDSLFGPKDDLESLAGNVSSLDTRQTNDNNTLKLEIDSKLDASDQRYNNSAFASGIQTNLSNQITQQTNDNNTQKAEIDLKLDITDQRYNDSSNAVWTLNTTVLRNESGAIGVVKSWWDGLYADITAFLSLVGNVTSLDSRQTADNNTLKAEIDTNTGLISTLDTKVDNNNNTQKLEIDLNTNKIVSVNGSLETQKTQQSDDNTTLKNEIDLKLTASDQRYNDSAAIVSLAGNQSADNSTQGLLIETNIADIDSIETAQGDYLNTSDMRFNESADVASAATNASNDNSTQGLLLDGLQTDVSSAADNLTILDSAMASISGNLTDQITQQQADNDTLKAEVDVNTADISNTALWPINTSALRNESGTLGVVWSLWTNFFKSITSSNADNLTQANLIDGLQTDISSVSGNLTTQIAQQIADNNTQKAEIDAVTNTDTRWLLNSTVLRNESDKIGIVIGFWDALYAPISLVTTQSDDNSTQGSLITGLQTDVSSASGNLTTQIALQSADNATQALEISNQIAQQIADNDTQKVEIDAKHTPGTCAAGKFVQNTTTGGVECLTPTDTDTDTRWELNTTVLRNETNKIGVVLSFWEGIFQTITQQQADNDTLKAEIDVNTGSISTLDTKVDDNNNTLKAEIDVNTGAISTLDTKVDDNNNTQALQISNQITQQIADNDTLKAEIDVNSGAISTLDTKVDDNNNTQALQISNQITQQQADNDTQKAEIDALADTDTRWLLNTTVMHNDSGGIMGINPSYWSSLYETIASHNADNDTLKAEIDVNAGAISTLDTKVDDNNNTLKAEIDVNTGAISTLDTKVDDNNNTLKAEIDVNAGAISTLDTKVDDNNNTLKGEIDTNSGLITSAAADATFALTGVASAESNASTESASIRTALDDYVNISGGTFTGPVVATDLSVINAPAVCPGGSFMTFTNMSSATCTAESNDDNYVWPINSTVLRNESGTLGVILSFWEGLFKSITASDADNDTQKAEIDVNAGDITANTARVNNVNTSTNLEKLGFVVGNFTIDTNESTRFNKLTSANCSFGFNMIGVNDSGGVICVVDANASYDAGNGMSLTGTTFSVAGNTALTQDADGLSVTDDAIGDTQLTFNTGQHLTSASTPTFSDAIIAWLIKHEGDEDTGIEFNDDQVDINAGGVQMISFIEAATDAIYAKVKLNMDNKDIESVATLTAININTGQGANELYAMDQPVQTTNDVKFASINATDAVGWFKTGNGGGLYWNSSHTCIVGPDGDIEKAVCDTN